MQLKRVLCLLLAAALLLLTAYAEEAIPEVIDEPLVKILYSIDVDIENQIVTVYDLEGEIVRQMICSTGYGTSTPRGTFLMEEMKYPAERTEWYYFGEYEIYAKYASRITGPFLFHSILFNSTYSKNPTWNSLHGLGGKASHGCVRLQVEDAKWIAENCPPGTEVRIFDDGERNEDLRELVKLATFSIDNGSYADFLKGYVPLSKGSRYSKVITLQEKLNEQGYDCGAPDGVFGAATERAVKAWQGAMGVEDDGVVTPEQLEAILTDTTPRPTPVPTPTPTPKPTPVPTPEPTPTPVPTPSPTPDISAMEGTIALVQVEEDSYLNLRLEPKVDSEVLSILTRGTPVRVLEEGLSWTKVEYEGKTGWTGSNYLEIVKRGEE